MADQYCKCLTAMGVRDVTVVSRKEESSRQCCEKYNFKALSGGYGNVLPDLGVFDLVIIATQVHALEKAARFAAECGNKNILVEKPGALFSNILKKWSKDVSRTGIRVRIAYNRLTYPSLWKLKEIITSMNTIDSCTYTFTEVISRINFNNNEPLCYERWGIANSLHVISMAHDIIGMPKKMDCHRKGKLVWHSSGSVFTGCGITDKNILFSYHANWESAGRWGIDVMARSGAYRFIPLEELWYCKVNSFNWEKINIEPAYPECKTGVAEELAVMLNPELEKEIPLVTLEKAAGYTELAEDILGYTSSVK